ncbi:MAG: hypothetical protein NC111_03980 [Bacteroides sp.]|nr:hypothetical protein [Bacteroides sp.]MCM1412962.1 hypothetical protein [Bacteroides sp.]MCM1471668.1 hypothetical protein [Bacteroides sp.]
MDDDKIKDLFSGFQPPLTSSQQFLDGLQNKLELVEMLEQQIHVLRLHNKLAVAIAAVCGFIAGVVMTLLFPVIEKWISGVAHDISLRGIDFPEVDYGVVGWVIVAGVCIFTAVNAYEIAISRLSAEAMPS